MLDMRVNICGVELKNPVVTASGTFGSGHEYSDFIDLSRLGAVIVKGVADKPWNGNKPPRIAEVYGGMINSVGLQNPGVDYFIKNDIPFLRQFDTKLIVNVCGHTAEEYVNTVKALRQQDVDMIELNISCPNIKAGGMAFGTDCQMAEKVVSEVKKYADKPLIVKLSPNVSDIALIAKAAENGGADAISLINTISAMKIDIYKRKTVLDSKIGGMSGPAIKPIAVRMVYQASKAVNIPIIGLGGISSGEDAIEFIMAGADAVAVGTANFMNPHACIDIIDGIEKYMNDFSVNNLSEIKGCI